MGIAPSAQPLLRTFTAGLIDEGSSSNVSGSRRSGLTGLKLRRDSASSMVRRRQLVTALAHIVCVGTERLADPFGGLLARRPKCDDAREIGNVGAPASIRVLLVDDDVFAHRRWLKPLARRMLLSVPTGTVSLSLPATTIRS
jgi:hypothetical protein